MSDRSLFATGSLSLLLKTHTAAITDEVRNWSKERILSVPIEDLVALLVDKYRKDIPVLKFDQRYVAGDGDAVIRVRPQFGEIDFGGQGAVRGEMMQIAVPFEGDPQFFHFRASTEDSAPPHAAILGNEVHVAVGDRKLTKELIEKHVDGVVKSIERYLDWQRKDTDPWNSALPALARKTIEERKAEFLARDNVAASLGIPIATRDNPGGFLAVSLQRKPKQLILPTTPVTAFTPEPALDDAQYGAILSAINRLATIIERNPDTFTRLDEPDIRNIVLVNLNSDFQRNATGETFNGSGKTDIIVNEQGKNVFIAECKIWTGSKTFLEAIDQLQSYATWRDSKTALLIFSKNTKFSDVLSSIKETVVQHPKFKREDRVISETETRYVFRHRDDDNKEMLVAICAFHLGGKSN